MTSIKCILTQRNAALLHRLLDTQHTKNSSLAQLLKSKLDNAQIWPEFDFPANIVTLNSRVTYRVNGNFTDTRIVSAQQSSDIVGLSLPITNLRGLALIGLREGQCVTLTGQNQQTDLIQVDKVQFQPEAHRQFLKDAIAANAPSRRRASIKLVHTKPNHHEISAQTSR